MITPKTFVSSYATLHPKAACTVAPVSRNKLLDVSFHIARLAQSTFLLDGNGSHVSMSIADLNLPQLADQVLNCLPYDQVNQRDLGVVTVCASRSSAGEWDTQSLFSPLNKENVFAEERSVRVEVRCYERTLPLAKHVRWPIERRNLELDPSSDRTGEWECLLAKKKCDEAANSLELTEGLTSSLIVVRKNEPNTLYLPPPGSALEGSMSNIISLLAPSLGMDVKRSPLLLSNISEWQGAYLTSATKPLVPIAAIHVDSSQGLSTTGSSFIHTFPSPLMTDTLLLLQLALRCGIEGATEFLPKGLKQYLWLPLLSSPSSSPHPSSNTSLLECIEAQINSSI